MTRMPRQKFTASKGASMAGRSARPIFRPDPGVSSPVACISYTPHAMDAHAMTVTAKQIITLR
jgi:hypothetical protein